MSDSNRAFIKRWLFKNSHWTVPDDRSRVMQTGRKHTNGLNTDVHTNQADVCELDRDRLCHDLLAFDWFVTIDNLMIGGKQERDSLLFRSLFDLASSVEHVVFNERLSDCKTFGLQKRVGHCTADQQLVHAAIDQCINDWNLI